MPIRFVDWYTSEQITADEDAGIYYVFGDNAERRGFGGQAKEARGHINSIGVVTKMRPEHGTPKCYLHDENFFQNVAVINGDLDIVQRRLREGKIVCWPSAGIGTDRAMLKSYAPRTLEYINMALKVLCDKYGYEGEMPDMITG